MSLCSYENLEERKQWVRDLFEGDAGMKARVHEISEFRNRQYVFKDRMDAGKALGLMLAPVYEGAKDVMVLAIPSGGVPVALEVCKKLKCPMDLIIVRKLQIPGNPEAGFGALTGEGCLFLNDELLGRLRLDRDQLEKEKRTVEEELEKRNKLFRGDKPFPDLQNKRVILVDDGLASGYTMMASLFEVRSKGAAVAAVAVPTAPLTSIRRIENGADEIYCANIREGSFFAVAGAYEDWYDLSQEEVLNLLHKQAGFPTPEGAGVSRRRS
jgi:putative phosphoribosyl transferase